MYKDINRKEFHIIINCKLAFRTKSKFPGNQSDEEVVRSGALYTIIGASVQAKLLTVQAITGSVSRDTPFSGIKLGSEADLLEPHKTVGPCVFTPAHYNIY
ncbi:hypothetical protein J6590_046967 [Homalodisca vitripennis]|nr:hypothetical protein J6590_046967 [Homalodisca vitripennis]